MIIFSIFLNLFFKKMFSDDRESFLDRAVGLISPELRPIPPQPSCPDSMQIYQHHRLVCLCQWYQTRGRAHLQNWLWIFIHILLVSSKLSHTLQFIDILIKKKCHILSHLRSLLPYSRHCGPWRNSQFNLWPTEHFFAYTVALQSIWVESWDPWGRFHQHFYK